MEHAHTYNLSIVFLITYNQLSGIISPENAETFNCFSYYVAIPPSGTVARVSSLSIVFLITKIKAGELVGEQKVDFQLFFLLR